MPIRRRVPLALLALVCLAGCGPPKAQTPGHYALKGTANCLKKGGAKVVLNNPGSTGASYIDVTDPRRRAAGVGH